MTLQYKDGNARFTTVCLITYELYIHVFVSVDWLFSFVASLQKLLAHFLLIRDNGEIHRKKNSVRVRKTMLSSTFMIRLQGYSWKSGIAFIALQSLKITWTTPEMFPIWTPCCPQSKFWQDILILSWVRVFWEIFTPNWRMQDSRSSRSRFS